MKQNRKILSVILALALTLSVLTPLVNAAGTPAANATKATSATEGFANYIKNTANQFVVVKHKQLGASYFAYTEALSDSRDNNQPDGDEYNFQPGSEMVLLTYDENDVEKKAEEVLLDSPNGVIRDPDISPDGTKVLYSHKPNANDDFHLYEMDLKTREIKKLTFGQGVSDIEGKYLPNGKLIFSSTRDVQTVDCWKTPVSHLYTCDADGKNILRLTYDQVHDVYPTVTSDGRVLYMRWDYNDRTQMYIQAFFQMFPDGTNQTEVFGNNSSFPTTLIHSVEIPGQPGKYYSIASGHHVTEDGKLCMIDTTIDRNEYKGDNNHAVTLLDAKNNGALSVNGADEYGHVYNYDKYGQTGWVYKYPVGISENELLVSMTKNPQSNDGYVARSARYGIYYTFVKEDGSCEYILMSDYSTKRAAGAAQIAPIPKTPRTMTERPSMVNYGKDTGVYYLGNVYEGEALEGIKKPTIGPDGNVTEKGEVKQLRVVEIEYRSSAIGLTGQGNNVGGRDGGWGNPYSPIAIGNGSWDVKRVLGVVDVEDDGSAMFEVPSETPVYFQLLNDQGQVIQTMRSWTTLMPGETFSCVGCHENKNSVPPSTSTVTMAMKKGVQKLKAESWMEKDGSAYKDFDPYTDEGVGFSYMTEVQPILDKSCVSCHNNTDEAYGKIGYSADSAPIVSEREKWDYSTTAPTEGTSYASDYAPFGTLGTSPNQLNTVISTDKLYLKKTFTVTKFQLSKYDFELSTVRTGDATIKVNGDAITYDALDVQIPKDKLHEGENTIEVELSKSSDGKMYFDAAITACDLTSVYWYADEYDTSGWKTSATGGFGGDWGANKYSNKDLAIKRTFNLTQEQISNLSSVAINIKYDEDPHVYINGKQVWTTGGYYDSGYANIDLTNAARDLLKAGDNTIGVSVTNNTGGKGLDLDLVVNGQTIINRNADGWKYFDGVPPKEGSAADLIPQASEWKYTTNNPGNNWYRESFSDSSWQTGHGLFGNSNTCATSWTTSNIWLRKTFTIADQNELTKLQNSTFTMSIYYDENPHVYVNGTEIFTASGYNNGYASNDVTSKIKDVLKVGTNTIAVSAVNTEGGAFIDLGIKAVEKSDIPISFEGTLITNSTMRRSFPLSYLLLTGAGWSGENQGSPNGDVDGSRDNGYTTWISSMSGAQIQKPKRAGSIKSNIVTTLKNGHQNLLSEHKITDADIRAIEAWIDLCVPACGSYDELNAWDGQCVREYEEKLNKRNYYTDMNDATRAVYANAVEDNGELTISYISNGKQLGTATGVGTVQLNVASELKANNLVTVQLPKGKKYVAFRLDPRFEEAIIYCPSGAFSYVVPSDISKVFPRVLQSDEGTLRFRNLTMAARIPSDEELTTETRNLALNPYDLTTGNTVYPHVTTSSNYNNQVEFAGRNAIDGFTTNQGHGEWPYQSWGPNQGNGAWFNIDFGRTVEVDKLVVYTRADFPHDTNYVSANLEFSDGTTQPVSLYRTKEGIELDLDKPVDTTYVKIKDLTCADTNWAGLAEVQVFGTEAKADVKVDVPATGVKLDKTEGTLAIGETVQLNATVSPNNASIKTVNWTTSDVNVATVDQTGKVKAVGNGTAEITATSTDGSDKSATYKLTVLTKVTSVTVTPKSIENAEIGKTQQLTAEVLPANATQKTLNWTTSNAAVATVNQSGLVTFVGKGTAVITATSTDGTFKSATCNVSVTRGTAPGGTTPGGNTPQNGTGTVGGKTVLYQNGKQVTGTIAAKVGGKTYAVVGGFVSTGSKNHTVTIGKTTYIADKNGVILTGSKNHIVKIGKISYVLNAAGAVQKASGKVKYKTVKVGKKTYLVNKKGVLQKPKKLKLYKANKKTTYIVNKRGYVQIGKKYKAVKVGKKTYLVNKKGVVLRNKKSLKVGKIRYKIGATGVAKKK